MQNPKIIIIGGGLSGLTTAYLLKKEGLYAHVIEGRKRLGGRIYTSRNDKEAPIEMGATWLGKKHQHLLELLNELDIGIYEQYMGRNGYYEPMSISPPQLVGLPPNEEPSYRIEGGSDNLIHSLTDFLGKQLIVLNQAVSAIQKNENNLTVETNRDRFKADIVISTLPPKLLVNTITFTPSLPDKLLNIAKQTHTWMAESIKIALTFEKPFWRESNSSGTIFSNVGPITEMYDHSNGDCYALKGFMNDAYHSVSRKQRKQLVLEQLRRFYGNRVSNFQSYYETVWQKEPFTYSNYNEHVIPHQYNGHSIFQKAFWDDHLLISGSETAKAFPGYMDGAVESAHRTVDQLKTILS